MKIAIVHEMLIKLGGAEKVVERLMQMFPDSDLFTLIYDEKKVESIFPKKNKITGKDIQVGKITQFIYDFTGKQRLCLPFMKNAVESFDLSKYDIVIVSSSGFAHGVITKPETKTIIYYHSPARYLWDWTNEYKRDIHAQTGIKGFLLGKLFLSLRIWDVIASERGDITIANSENVAKRIEKYYRKKAQVIYPPIETSRFSNSIESTDILENIGIAGKPYYIIIATLTEFKKIDIAIKNCIDLGVNLVIVGSGNYRHILEEMAKRNASIIFAGPRYGDELVELVQQSNGMIFPGEEDFGIVPIEVMAAGKPVFAYGKGGLLETVQDGISGTFFLEADGSDFKKQFKVFEDLIQSGKFRKETIQKTVEKYSEIHFEEAINRLVTEM